MIDLNADIAEGFPWDQGLLDFVTSANVCLGVHAGSDDLTGETILQCQARGIRVGLHPGLPDRESMGRTAWPSARISEARESVLSQVDKWCKIAPESYIKPHGTLYLQSSSDPHWAELVAELLRGIGSPLMGLAGTLHEEIASSSGVAFIREGFADRRKDAFGFLLPRDAADAFVSGSDQATHVLGQLGVVDSICLHGDAAACEHRARLLRETLASHGVTVTAG